ncbi:MAG: DivIVA domain-containing protein [Propionibacteriaceae bacterium]|jgi:DivIVA domain-containing protein|nr:DivIVA domain-containing protein [Propionibacteriaceae bacterium]
MELFLWIVVVIVLGLGALVATGAFGELPKSTPMLPKPHLPEGEITPEELRNLRFSIVKNGYSKAQVHEVLEMLADQLELAAVTNAGTPPVVDDSFPPTDSDVPPELVLADAAPAAEESLPTDATLPAEQI